MEKNINIVESEEYLVNIFIELIRKKIYSIELEDLLMLDFYYIETVNNNYPELSNILQNTKLSILEFVKKYVGYLDIKEIEGGFRPKYDIQVINPEDFLDLLEENYKIESDTHKDYKQAVKKYIINEKISA